MEAHILDIILRDGLQLYIYKTVTVPDRSTIMMLGYDKEWPRHYLDLDLTHKRVHGICMIYYPKYRPVDRYANKIIEAHLEFMKLVARIGFSLNHIVPEDVYPDLNSPIWPILNFTAKAYFGRRERAAKAVALRWRLRALHRRWLIRRVFNTWMQRACRPVEGKLYQLYARQWQQHLCAL